MKKFRNLFFISALLSMIGVSNATVVPTGSMLTQYAGNWESTTNYNFRQVLLNGASLYYTQYSVTRNGNYYIVNNTTIPVIGVAPESSSAWSLVSSSASGGGFVNTIGTINAESGAANGAKIVGNSLYLQYATSTTPGVLSTSAQTISGPKTFSNGIIGNLTGSSSLIATTNEVLASANYYPTFVSDSATNSSQVLRTDNGIRYNPNTNTFFADNVTGQNANFSVGITAPTFTGISSSAINLTGTSVNSLPYQTASATTGYIPSANNSVLVTNGSGVPSFSTTLPAVNGSNLTNVNAISATTATNIAGGTANQIPYQTGAGATSYVVAPTTGNTYLHWTGSTWEYITPFGWYNYQDTATSGTPIAVTGGVNTELTNNAAGPDTSTTYGVTGVSTVWNTGTNRFNFTSLNPGDFVNLRVTVVVTTTAANQEVTLKFNGGIGGTPFTLNIADVQFKTAGAHQISADTMVAMYNTNTTNNPASISILSDDNCTVVVNSFLISVNKR